MERAPRVIPLRGGRGDLLLVTLAEAFHPAGRVHELLLAGEEGMTVAADLDAQLLLRGVGRPGHAAGAVDQHFVVFGMQVLFHGTEDSTARRFPAQPGVRLPFVLESGASAVFYLYVPAPGMPAPQFLL